MNHDELVLLAELSNVNQDVARYIGRVLDVDQRRTEFTKSLADVERELAARLLAIGQALDAHARSRTHVRADCVRAGKIAEEGVEDAPCAQL